MKWVPREAEKLCSLVIQLVRNRLVFELRKFDSSIRTPDSIPELSSSVMNE